MMTLDPAGLEAAAKLARSCTPTAREDARLAEQIVRAYLAATPDPPKPPPPPLVELVLELEVDGSPYPIPASAVPAASPDERLREALREIVDTAPGIDRWTIDRRLDDEQWTGKVAVEVVRASSVDVMVAALRAALAAADREKPDLPPGVRCRPGFAPPVPDEPKEKP